MKKIFTLISVVSLFSLPFVSFASTVDWMDACPSYLGTAVNTADATSTACDISGPTGSPDGLISGDDFTLALTTPGGFQITIADPISPVSVSGGVGVMETGGGQLQVGTVICSQFASTCGMATMNGWVTYPNPSWNN